LFKLEALAEQCFVAGDLDAGGRQAAEVGVERAGQRVFRVAARQVR
jgi:hypothetical protein